MTATSSPGQGFLERGFFASGDAGRGSMVHHRVSLTSEINPRLRTYREQGKFVVIQVQGYPRAGDSFEALERWLEETDLELIDVLHFGEEHPHDAVGYLDALYEAVKRHSDVPVYSWYSMPLGPAGQADGYWYDYYGKGYTAFRDKVRQYLATGKPLGITVDGSGYSPWELAREQVMVCHEFDLPVSYFVAESQQGGAAGWYEATRKVYAPNRHFVFSAMEFQRRTGEPWRLGAGDWLWGDLIEVGPDEDGAFEMEWQGIGPATVYGWSRLLVEDDVFGMSGEGEVALDYPFVCMVPIEDIVFEIDVEGDAAGLSVSWSQCGRSDDWRELEARKESKGRHVYELQGRHEEWRLRVSLTDPEVSPASMRISGRVAATERRVIELYPGYYHGWRKGIRFRQDFTAGQWRYLGNVEGDGGLELGNQLALRGKSGRPVTVTLTEEFRSAKPLEALALSLDYRIRPGHGGEVRMGVSLDGKNVLRWSAWKTESGVLTVEAGGDERFRGVETFFVHLEQRNQSGIAGAVSSQLLSLSVEAAVSN